MIDNRVGLEKKPLYFPENVRASFMKVNNQ